MQGTAHRSRAHRSALISAAFVLLLTGCGTRLNRTEVVDALGARSTTKAQAAAAGGATNSSDTATTLAVAAGGATITGGDSAAATGGEATPGGAAATGASADTVDPSLSTVVLGNIGEYSGPVAASLGGGKPMASVLEQWLNDHGGLGRHPVKIIVADNGGDPSRYQAQVKDMVENQGVVAFVGNQIPLTAPGADQYLQSKGVPIVSGEGAHSLWQTSPVMFFPGASWGPQWAGMALAAASRGKPKLAILYCGEAEPCRTGNQAFSTYKSTLDAAGVSVVYSAQVSIVQPDYTAECLQAKNKGADAVITAMDANSLSRVVRSCRAQGYNPLYLTGGLALVTSLKDDANLQGQDLIGINPMTPWVSTDTPAVQEFQNAIQTYNPSMDNSEAAVTVWLGGMALRAASKNLPANPTSADIVAGLNTITNETFGGMTPPITFTAGQPHPSIDCYYTVELTGGQWIAPSGSQDACLS